jgi:hypothetical protein
MLAEAAPQRIGTATESPVARYGARFPNNHDPFGSATFSYLTAAATRENGTKTSVPFVDRTLPA